MKIYEFIVNTIATVGGGAILAIPCGAVGLAVFGVAGLLTDSLTSAALFAAVGGVIWAYVLFGVIMTLPFRPFSFPPMPFKKMLGWYIAFAVGYGVGPLAAHYINQSGFVPWSLVVSVLCSGGLPLLVIGLLQPLGIVGFPNRKFN